MKRMKRQVGKNTLGGGRRMSVDLRTYNRSTHDLSFAWRSSMGVGTLVPFMCQLAIPGDTFDIELNQKIMTHPTTGPLFGTYKAQFDVFTCPIRLYQAMLHNNPVNVGLNMSKVKLPKFQVFVSEDSLPTKEDKWKQINPSSLLAYLGRRGFSGKASQFPNTDLVKFLAVPAIAYYDIFKNYYANKQEENWYTISNNNLILFTNFINVNREGYWIAPSELILKNVKKAEGDNIYLKIGDIEGTLTELEAEYVDSTNSGNNCIIKPKGSGIYIGTNKVTANYINGKAELKEWKLTDIDDVREAILSKGKGEYVITNNDKNYLGQLIDTESGSIETNNVYLSSKPQFGLALKTHQSDIFNNWINSEWIDGENGIAEITAIDVSSGKLRLDQLNLQQKVYNLLNRVALSGGTYKDWIETVYTVDFQTHTETPIYEGGMSAEVIFQEVVSTNTGGTEALGTLAGRGVSVGQKHGQLHINIKEPSFIIGIVSLTPRVDYCQGNEFYTELNTMDDLHKPELDGIGYQDLTANKMAYWKSPDVSIGKQPAWIDYMTNVNKTFGNFVIEDNENFMVLNRYYYPKDDDYKNGELNYTTYINPHDYNYIFADTAIDSQNFWVQIGVKMKARRKMSAKQIPNL